MRVKLKDEILAMTDKSKLIRTRVSALTVSHRTSFGGLFMQVEKGERLVSASVAAPEFL